MPSAVNKMNAFGLPHKTNLRHLSCYVTTVKPYATCWAFSTQGTQDLQQLSLKRPKKYRLYSEKKKGYTDSAALAIYLRIHAWAAAYVHVNTHRCVSALQESVPLHTERRTFLFLLRLEPV